MTTDAADSLDARIADWRGVAELRDALRSGKVSARQLVDEAIARIEAGDRALNAVVVRDFERARSAATDADRKLAAGDRSPLLGIPMTVKESYDIAGLPTTWGIPAGRDWRPGADAVLVQRVKAAGAIVIGKTNVPFGLGDWQTYNEIYGTTNNPWDLGRSPGGSSGGAAVALAAGYVPLELGSDIGGSLRVPAHFCGVYAHKPSQALLPIRGHTPPGAPASSRDVDLAVVGPMARNVADLTELFELLAGPDESIATGYRLALPAPRHQRLQDFRVLVLTDHPDVPTSADVHSAIESLAARLAERGVTVLRRHDALPDLGQSARVYMQILNAFFGADIPTGVYARLQQHAAQLPPDDNSLAAARLRGMTLSHRDWVQADRQRGGIIGRWRRLFGDIDVVLCPVVSTVAFPQDQSPIEQRKLDVDGQAIPYVNQLAWPGLATLAGLPATAIPIGLSPAGLPVGAQLIGPFLEDRTPLRFAACIEREFGGFVRPPAVRAG
ncbi:MAG: amidase family protein [Burkholderiaceae bacterium]|jgi:amidase|nr:MAG: amidase family protein [Burkholderiaceae bacterium]